MADVRNDLAERVHFMLPLVENKDGAREHKEQQYYVGVTCLDGKHLLKLSKPDTKRPI